MEWSALFSIVLINILMLTQALQNSHQKSRRQKPRCLLTSNVKILSCQTAARIFKGVVTDIRPVTPNHGESSNSWTDADNANSVSAGTRCVLTWKSGHSRAVICLDGNWQYLLGSGILILDSTPPKLALLSRTRRATIDLTQKEFGLAEGSSPPNIICPFIKTPIYTQKGKVTISVSWEEATAHDQEAGILQVTQTQGQKSGTQHAEGEHTVAYITTDSHGYSAICSSTFTVIVRRCGLQWTYLLHGTVSCQPPENPNIPGSKCSYSCQKGYQLMGDSILECQEDGVWNRKKPVCRAISCQSAPPIERGSLVCQTEQHTYLSQCLLICDRGYTAAGETDIITCQNNGQWSPTVKCDLAQCQTLEAPNNAGIKCSHGNYNGSVCKISCNPPYRLSGQAHRICQANQTWSGKQPDCVKKCPTPPTISNGKYVCQNGSTLQSNCSLTCEEGYRPRAPLTITCENSGQWTQSGVCEDIVPPTFLTRCPTNITVSTVNKQQKVNYSLPSAQDNTGENVRVEGKPASGSDFGVGTTPVVITAADSWGNQVTCQFAVTVTALLCPDPHKGLSTSDPISYVCPEGYSYSSVCTASCNDGTTLMGSSWIICHNISEKHYDAVQWQPSGTTMPYCQDKCSPGQFSASGNQPCEVCDFGYYQTEYGQTSCTLCPFGTKTFIPGARSRLECKSVGIVLHPFFEPPLIELKVEHTLMFTVACWIHLKPETPRTTFQVRLDPKTAPAGSAYLTFGRMGIYFIIQDGNTRRSFRYWNHAAVIFDIRGRTQGKLTLYFNGKVVDEIDGVEARHWASESISFELDQVGSLFTFIKNQLTISHLEMTLRALSEEEVTDLYMSCDKHLEGNIMAATVKEASDLPSQCDTTDDCLENPCGEHGTCLDEPDGFTCLCDDQWTGIVCHIPPNYCTNNQCANGATCHSHLQHSNYTCLCNEGYKGPLCQEEIENGGWGMWEEWSTCNSTCGKGQRSRKRQCNNPKPDPEGKGCSGEKTQQQACLGNNCPVDGGFGEWSHWSQCSVTCGGGVSERRRHCDNPLPSNEGAMCDTAYEKGRVQCNMVKCPECPSLVRRPGYQSIDCANSVNSNLRNCSITCKPGMTLLPVSGAPTSLLCGYLTNYRWSHESITNPTGLLQDCAAHYLPDSATAKLDFAHQNTLCATANGQAKGTASLKEELIYRMGCNDEMTCNFNVTVEYKCRDQDPAIGSVTVQLKRGQSAGPHSLNTSSVSENETDLAEPTLDLAFMELQQLSQNMLNVSMANSEQMVSFTMVEMSVRCRRGATFYKGFCVDCPSGTYLTNSRLCTPCEKGFFQNQTKMPSCFPCQKCYTTQGVGAYSVDQCNIDTCDTSTVVPAHTEDAGSSSSQQTVIIAVAVAVAVVGLCISLAVVIIIVRRKHRKDHTHPYDIPGQTAHDDPYATLPDDPYDGIDDEENTNGSGSYIKPKYADYDLSNGSYDKIDDGITKLPIQNSNSLPIKRELPVPGAFHEGNDDTTSANRNMGNSYLELQASAQSFSDHPERKNEPDVISDNSGKTNPYLDVLASAQSYCDVNHAQDSAGKTNPYLDVLASAQSHCDVNDAEDSGGKTNPYLDVLASAQSYCDVNDADDSGGKTNPYLELLASAQSYCDVNDVDDSGGKTNPYLELLASDQSYCDVNDADDSGGKTNPYLELLASAQSYCDVNRADDSGGKTNAYSEVLVSDQSYCDVNHADDSVGKTNSYLDVLASDQSYCDVNHADDSGGKTNPYLDVLASGQSYCDVNHADDSFGKTNPYLDVLASGQSYCDVNHADDSFGKTNPYLDVLASGQSYCDVNHADDSGGKTNPDYLELLTSAESYCIVNHADAPYDGSKSVHDESVSSQDLSLEKVNTSHAIKCVSQIKKQYSTPHQQETVETKDQCSQPNHKETLNAKDQSSQALYEEIPDTRDQCNQPQYGETPDTKDHDNHPCQKAVDQYSQPQHKETSDAKEQYSQPHHKESSNAQDHCSVPQHKKTSHTQDQHSQHYQNLSSGIDNNLQLQETTISFVSTNPILTNIAEDRNNPIQREQQPHSKTPPPHCWAIQPHARPGKNALPNSEDGYITPIWQEE